MEKYIKSFLKIHIIHLIKFNYKFRTDTKLIYGFIQNTLFASLFITKIF